MSNKPLSNMNRFIYFDRSNEDIRNAMAVEGEYKKYILRFLDEKQNKYHFNTYSKKYFMNSFFPSFPGKAWERIVNAFEGVALHSKRIPFQVDMAVTGRCHCDCWHCFRSESDRADLSFKDILNCFESLDKMGTATVGITGGEPMIRDDIEDIINSIPDSMEGVLYTTGYRITEAFLNNIKGSNLSRCIISLDHYEKDIVNSKRNYGFAYDDAVNAIQRLSDTDFYTSVTVCLTEDILNENFLDEYYDFISGLGANEMRISYPISQGKLKNYNVKDIYLDGPEAVADFKKRVRDKEKLTRIFDFNEMESGEYMGCCAGSAYFSINNDGNVLPCVANPLSYGSIYEDSIENIFMRMEKWFPGPCKLCNGKLSSTIMKRLGIDVTGFPLDTEQSIAIAEACKEYRYGIGKLFKTVQNPVS
jgi:MoaA/NifB/PqqE/SkfB family radical SAM enzyme